MALLVQISHVTTSINVFFQMMNKNYKTNLEFKMDATLKQINTIIEAISYSQTKKCRYSNVEIQSIYELEKITCIIKGTLCALIDAIKLSPTINHADAVFATETIAQCKEIIIAVELSSV